MCNAIADGGERCFYSLYQPRLNRLEATLNKKEEELAALYRLKMKPAEVRRRINELETTIAHKRSRIARIENLLEAPPQGATIEQEVSRTEADIRVLEDEVADLNDIRVNTKKHSRKIRDLEALITRKRTALQELRVEAEEARKQHEAEDSASATTQAELDAQVNRRALTKLLNEDNTLPKNFHFLLTPEEREQVDAERGDEKVGDFLLRRSLTAAPVFSDSSAATLIANIPVKKTRHERSASRALKNGEHDVVGRKPSVDSRIRSEEVTVAGEVKGRAILRYFEGEMAKHYGLKMNQYARRRALGIDLYSNEGDIGSKVGAARLQKFADVERRLHIPVTDPETGRYAVDSVEALNRAREAMDRQAQEDAYKRAVKKFGADAVKNVFAPYSDDLPFDLAA